MDFDSTIKLSLDVAKAIDDLECRVIPDPVSSLRIAVAILMQPIQSRDTLYEVYMDRVVIQYHTRALLKVDEFLTGFRHFDRSVVLKAIHDELQGKCITTQQSTGTATLEQRKGHMETHWQAPAQITKLKGMTRAADEARLAQLIPVHGSTSPSDATDGPKQKDTSLLQHDNNGGKPHVSLPDEPKTLPIAWIPPQGEPLRNFTPMVAATPAVGASTKDKRVDSGVSGVFTEKNNYTSPEWALVVEETLTKIIRDFGAWPAERPIISRIGPDGIDYDPKVMDFAHRFWIWEDKHALIRRPPRPVSWSCTIAEHLRQFHNVRQNAHDEAEGLRLKKASEKASKAWKKIRSPPPKPPMLILTTVPPEEYSVESGLEEQDENHLAVINPELVSSDNGKIERRKMSSKLKKAVAKQMLEDEPTLVFSPNGTEVYLGSCVSGFRHLKKPNTKGLTLPFGMPVPVRILDEAPQLAPLPSQ